MEPEYVAAGDEFDDMSWHYPNTDFERRILRITRRNYFQSQVQAKRVRAIEAHSKGDAPKYPPAYLEQLFKWCEKMNYTRTVIILDSLINVIRNPDNLAKYYKDKPIVEDRSGYDVDSG